MNRKIYIFGALLALLVLTACQGGKTTAGEAEEGDTLKMKYAKLLTIVKHWEKGTASLNNDAEDAEYQYAEVNVANPWKAGTLLHRYILIPKGKEGDETVARLALQRTSGMGCTTDTVRTPVERSAVFIAPHCQLMYELGCQQAIRGVCDLDYINIPDVKKRAASAGNAAAGNSIVDCGSSMAPDIERIIALNPEAILLSPFENSGGYGKLDKLHIPIIEAADYMESSPLGRAEWMKFYGMLFKKDGNAPKTALAASCEPKADSLFAKIEKEYLKLKAEAAGYPKGLSILTERKTGNVWYVPGGQSTIGILLKDANARYIFEDDEHSGSLAMSPEQILAKGKQVDVWAFKYFGGAPLSQAQLLQEYDGYKALAAFNRGNIYQVDTSTVPYFELTSFHPELLLREFIILAHGERFGKLRFYKK
ncbi:ABC transporter substrate-binding protein [Prevotella copri]|uniref:ABC transporter substrate-binding protein n=2 Tax=Segatella copri TaxID=165179 RepID=A0AAW4NAQ9_9BACT|nr:ABC transporter substrate-binding protein [Segatella copri]MBU9911980.1 ABC transporter substrate-binding protein [Segatella copri]MBV3399769.1 ABC transporter substrate-binding protein [Segatella copri]MBV3409324.1 ABC transporter substrate-binding protein [Segatella copri]MBV3412284.1 ABC transporter substrate-binding protein [Segatella copri]MBV3420693.1 ABC transporter substrate-binding protein [Segatella copri]